MKDFWEILRGSSYYAEIERYEFRALSDHSPNSSWYSVDIRVQDNKLGCRNH